MEWKTILFDSHQRTRTTIHMTVCFPVLYACPHLADETSENKVSEVSTRPSS